MSGTSDRASGGPSYDMVIAALVEARQSRRISQRELSRKLGKPPTFVSKIERGERQLGLVELFDVCAALGIDALPLLKDAFARGNGNR
jgi:transcriptional regulator with XRE-family HTH domain